MPAEDDELETETPTDEAGVDLPGLRKAARDGKKAVDENAKLKREMLFLRAGIDTETRLGQMLMQTFEGDDIEKLRAEATEIGLLKPAVEPEPIVDPKVVAQDQQRAANYDALSGGAPGGDAAPPTEDPRIGALKEYQVGQLEGVDTLAGRTRAMSKVLEAGASGDRRVFFDKAAHHAAAEEYNRLTGVRPTP